MWLQRSVRGWPLVEDPVGVAGEQEDQAPICACVVRPWNLVCFSKCWQVWGAAQCGEGAGMARGYTCTRSKPRRVVELKSVERQ